MLEAWTRECLAKSGNGLDEETMTEKSLDGLPMYSQAIMNNAPKFASGK